MRMRSWADSKKHATMFKWILIIFILFSIDTLRGFSIYVQIPDSILIAGSAISVYAWLSELIDRAYLKRGDLK